MNVVGAASEEGQVWELDYSSLKKVEEEETHQV
jgi:hypothetical protein